MTNRLRRTRSARWKSKFYKSVIRMNRNSLIIHGDQQTNSVTLSLCRHWLNRLRCGVCSLLCTDLCSVAHLRLHVTCQTHDCEEKGHGGRQHNDRDGNHFYHKIFASPQRAEDRYRRAGVKMVVNMIVLEKLTKS